MGYKKRINFFGERALHFSLAYIRGPSKCPVKGDDFLGMGGQFTDQLDFKTFNGRSGCQVIQITAQAAEMKRFLPVPHISHPIVESTWQGAVY